LLQILSQFVKLLPKFVPRRRCRVINASEYLFEVEGLKQISEKYVWEKKRAMKKI
jgi:hypothetical protein